MNSETIKAIQSALSPLAEKFGQGAEALWSVYIKQIYIESAITIVVSVVVIVASVVMALKLYKRANAKKTNNYVSSEILLPLMITFLCVFSFVAIFIITDDIIHLLNPEYEAIQRILGQVTGKG